MRPGGQPGNSNYDIRQVTPGFDNHEEDHDCWYCGRQNVSRHQVCMCLQGVVWMIHECGRIKLLNYIDKEFKTLREKLLCAYSK